MFLSAPDAPASTLTQRDVLRLVFLHAFAAMDAPASISAMWAVAAADEILRSEELEAGPAPADDVVGALADAARFDRFENAAPRALSPLEYADKLAAAKRAREAEQDQPAPLLGEAEPTLDLDNLGGSPE